MAGTFPGQTVSVATESLAIQMCDNIDVSDYMSVTEFVDGGNQCIEVTGLLPGRGQDNPDNFDDVVLISNALSSSPINNCNLYDTCPSDGVSGGVVNFGRYDDSISCTPNQFDTGSAVGEYPATFGGKAELIGNPYRRTMPKFICMDFPAGQSSITFKCVPQPEAHFVDCALPRRSRTADRPA
eukprot:scaffold67814_cov32-Tisochrysis_lutea.AAC.3